MKEFLKIIFKLFLILIVYALIKTAFELKTNWFFTPEEDLLFMSTVFSVLLIILAGILCYYILSIILISKKKKTIISILFVVITTSYFFIEFHQQSTMLKNGDTIGLLNTNARSYTYDEKLMFFDSPFQLNEQKLSDSNFNNKSYTSADLSIYYLEVNAEAMEQVDPKDNKEELRSQFINLELPKHFFIMSLKRQGIDITSDAIEIKKISENEIRLSIDLPDGTESIMFFLNKGYFFSTLQIVRSANPIATDVSTKILKSIIIK